MGAVRLRAGALSRSHRAATLCLAVFAGIGGALPMAAWAAARRTDHALDAFVRRSDIADTSAFFCPADVGDPAALDPTSPQGRAAQEACARYDPRSEAARLRALPGIEAAQRNAFVVGQFRLDSGPLFAGVNVAVDPGPRHASGKGALLAGRWYRDDAVDELVLPESAVRNAPDVAVGSRVRFTPFLATQAGCAGEGSCAPAGESEWMTVVGIVRQPADLVAQTDASGEVPYLPYGWWRSHGAGAFRYGVGVNVWGRDDQTAAEVEVGIERAFPGRSPFFESTEPHGIDTLSDAISYEVRAGLLLSIAAAAAALTFVGQAVVRQARREHLDLHVLRALGASRRTVVSAAALRGSAIALLAAVLAFALAAVASPVGPYGVARRTRLLGFSLDWFALGIGAVVVFGATLALATAPVYFATARRPARTVSARRRVASGPRARWATVSTGLTAAFPDRRSGGLSLRFAVVTCALAIAGLLTAATLVASLDGLVEHPGRFGVTWDLVVGNIDSAGNRDAAYDAVSSVDGVASASGLLDGRGEVAGRELPLLGLTRVPGLPGVDPVIVEGRRPERPGEIALGAQSMRDLATQVGDEIELKLADAPGAPATKVRVVGQVVLNDEFSLEAGTGGLVDAEWLERQVGGQPQEIAVRLDRDSSRASVIAALRRTFPENIVEPVPPSGVRNLMRIDGVPWLLAAVVAGLAVAAVAHALATSVRARRRELAVLKSVGFTRSQVMWSIAWQATAVAGAAVIVGLPLGVLPGRLGWSKVASGLGVVVVTSVPPLAGLGAALLMLTTANLFVAIPGWLAARARPAPLLRSE